MLLLTLGLNRAAPKVSISSVLSRPNLPDSPAPSWILQTLFAETLALCHISWPRSTGYPFPGHSWPGMYICVHTCVCVACSSACLAMLLPAPLPSMSLPSMFLPWLQYPENTGVAFRKLVATASRDLLCRTECELFN